MTFLSGLNESERSYEYIPTYLIKKNCCDAVWGAENPRKQKNVPVLLGLWRWSCCVLLKVQT